MLTEPVPDAVSSRLAFDDPVVIVLSVMLTPSMVAPPVNVDTPVTDRVPEKSPVPSTMRFSLMLIVLLSELVIVVPFTLIPSMSTPAVPLPVMVTDEFVVSEVMLSLFTDNASISTVPVPFGCIDMSPFVTEVVSWPSAAFPM